MNIFVVDEDPEVAARQLCDKHVVKMILETAQMLCTVAHNHGYEAPYKVAHPKHPCTLWAGKSAANWTWLIDHGLAMSEEYTERYGRTTQERSCYQVVPRPTNQVSSSAAYTLCSGNA
jgi:hypothetical protein